MVIRHPRAADKRNGELEAVEHWSYPQPIAAGEMNSTAGHPRRQGCLAVVQFEFLRSSILAEPV